jgi:hypothetical protein
VRRAALLPNDNLNIANFRFRVHLGPGEAPEAGAGAHEHTQQMDAGEVANLLRKAAAKSANGGNGPVLPIQPNILPDVYPDEKKSE